MLSPSEKRDKIIRATDLDALSCRYSTNNKSYFQPADNYINKIIASYQNHLQFCKGYSQLSAGRTLRSVFNEQKLPLINRGTYLRTKVIDLVVEEFIKEFKQVQIISLGGGSDTRCFRVFEKYQENIKYIEFDFPESVKIKKLAIENDEELKKLIGDTAEAKEIGTKEEFVQLESELHTAKYHLIGFDLRELDQLNEDYIDKDTPTLILSECVLCYLTPKENEDIMSYWKNKLDKRCYLIYEPMSLNDAFGETMTQNLSNRGIDLHTFHKYPNLTTRHSFFRDTIGLNNVKLTDTSDIAGYSGSLSNKEWISTTELNRINRLELIDELEEIRLLFKHYCLCYGELHNFHFNGINKYKWMIE
ncbi:leucine carboxyl methyltransferase 1 [Hyphopichia burtonii NRRL Y-1933]|uniref:Leucine carboxyl methyltransferase 1 n=1 Tax=Hyphopichia burtonii NRRL Y-1933 TaxID=984485 RepID=A0A1E4RD87_9ASCO|nr:leucine carboxyl methyltransferase 1 [Hyphopichia burtonii NRRL Y-1933]ODV65234.1 leucine carboxyl methyltransferase 1 [Hyphopichia burtonii NRRL Y-1933]